MANLAKLVPLPPSNQVNQGLSRLRESTALRLLGVPGTIPDPGETCGTLTNANLRAMIEKRNIAKLQFSVRGPRIVLDSLEEIFEEFRVTDPELFDKCRTNGSHCVRRIRNRGRAGPWSNHAWGLAIDLGFQPAGPGEFISADPRGDGKTEQGLLKLVPFFNRHGWFWGGAFSGDSEDSMHFEVSEQLAEHLFANGPDPNTGGGQSPRTTSAELKHPDLASDPGMQQVAAGDLFLSAGAEKSETVGVLQDSLNALGKAAFKVALGPGKKRRGLFGPETDTAVRKFQQSEGLGEDGVVGKDTLAALDRRLIEATGLGDLSHPLLSGDPTLQAVAAGQQVREQSGTRAPGVSALQDALNALSKEDPGLAVDLGQNDRFRGFFGPKTRQAVERFQKSKGLDVNGVVGDSTIKAIDEALKALAGNSTPDPETGAMIEGPDGYRPPEGARSLLGTIPLKEAESIDPEAVGIHRDQSEIILKLQSGVLFFEAGMQTDADGSPRARDIDRFGQLETAFNFPNASGQKRFVDAESVHYIVLPDARLNTSERFFNQMGLALGDIAAVIFDGHIEFAMFADVGPFGKLGEGSVRLVQALGIDPFIDGKIAIGIGGEVVYLVFPGSRPSGLTPSNAMEKISQVGMKLFRDLGGRIPPTDES